MLRRKGFVLSESKGFTLIELLIVIAIIGILATMVIMNVSKARAKAVDTKVASDIASIARAVDISKAEGTAPNHTIIPLGDLTPENYSGTLGLFKDNSGVALIGSNPKHPIAGEYYKFYYSSDVSMYIIAGKQKTTASSGEPTYKIQVSGYKAVVKVNFGGDKISQQCVDVPIEANQCIVGDGLETKGAY